jgi:hypothetical protein
MGKLARQWCVAQASYDAVRPVLANAIGIALARR